MCCVEASDRRPGASREAAGSASDPLGSRRLDTCACSHVSSSEFPTQPVVERGRIAYICIPCSTTVRSTLHRLIKYSVRFDRRRSGFGCCAPRGRTTHRAYRLGRRSLGVGLGVPGSRRRPARRARGPAGTSRAAGGRLFVRGRGGSPDDLRRLRAPPAGSGTRRGGAAGAAHRNSHVGRLGRGSAGPAPAARAPAPSHP